MFERSSATCIMTMSKTFLIVFLPDILIFIYLYMYSNLLAKLKRYVFCFCVPTWFQGLSRGSENQYGTKKYTGVHLKLHYPNNMYIKY